MHDHISEHSPRPEAYLIKPLPGWRDRPNLQEGKGTDTNQIADSDTGLSKTAGRRGVGS